MSGTTKTPEGRDSGRILSYFGEVRGNALWDGIKFLVGLLVTESSWAWFVSFFDPFLNHMDRVAAFSVSVFCSALFVRMLLEKRGRPKQENFTIERAVVHADKTGNGVKLIIELAGGVVDTAGLVIGLYPHAGSVLGLRESNAFIKTVLHGNRFELVVRPCKETELAFQEITKAALDGKSVRVVLERLGDPVARSEGLTYSTALD